MCNVSMIFSYHNHFWWLTLNFAYENMCPVFLFILVIVLPVDLTNSWNFGISANLFPMLESFEERFIGIYWKFDLFSTLLVELSTSSWTRKCFRTLTIVHWSIRMGTFIAWISFSYLINNFVHLFRSCNTNGAVHLFNRLMLQARASVTTMMYAFLSVSIFPPFSYTQRKESIWTQITVKDHSKGH